MWVEFYEDYFDHHKTAMVEEIDEIEEGDNVQFVTGDDEYDDLERRITEGTISDEEVAEVLSRWEGKTPPTQATSDPDIGDGFNDTYRR